MKACAPITADMKKRRFEDAALHAQIPSSLGRILRHERSALVRDRSASTLEDGAGLPSCRVGHDAVRRKIVARAAPVGHKLSMDRRPLSPLVLVVLAWAGAAACGGKSSPTARNGSDAVVTVSDVRSRVDPHADVVAHVDAVRFRNSPFYEALESVLAMLPGADAERVRIRAQCGFDPLTSLRAVAASTMRADASASSFLLAARFSERPERVLDCIARLARDASTADLEGRKALATPEGRVIVCDRDLLLAGSRERILRALARESTSPPEDAPYLSLRSNALQAFGLNNWTFSVGPGPGGTRLDLLDEATSTDAAARAGLGLRELRERWKQRLSQLPHTEEGRRHATALLDSVVVEVKGTQASARLELTSTEAEAAFTSMLMELAAYAVKNHIVSSTNDPSAQQVRPHRTDPGDTRSGHAPAAFPR